MRWVRVALVLSVIAPALSAQQSAQSSLRTDPPRADRLTAEVHYGTAGDAWFDTNKPAYVALFDVSRGGVRQLYPTFTAQSTQLSGTSVRVDLRSSAPPPGGSSLVSLNAPAQSFSANGWPHTLLLVASTEPLRVGSSWTTNIAINNDLVRDHHWNDLDNDDGIAAVLDLVRPVDRGAEIATDRVQSATPVTYASSLSHDPSQTGTGYSCTDATHTFSSPVPMLGAGCFVTQGYPPVGASAIVAASVNAGGRGRVDTARVATSVRPAASGQSATRISEQRHGDQSREQGHAAEGHAPQGGPSHDPNRDPNRGRNQDQNRDQRHDARPSGGPPGGAPASQASGKPQGKAPTERE